MLNSIYQHLLDHQIGIIEHDTVPGIVGIATIDNAKKIQAIKQRSESKGFIVLIPSIDHLNNLAINISESAHQLINTYWPGPLTIILEKHPDISTVISGQKTTIAIRCPNHPGLSELLKKLNQPILSTSANISGETNISEKLLSAVDFTYGNIQKTETNIASTIIDATQTPFKILRNGSIKLK
tara:strand:+ start:27241 stop:27789 length:549 start_codon:yes stop_codon:yes gene_type:complete